MLYKRLSAYAIDGTFSWDPERVAAAAFQPPASFIPMQSGWSAPIGTEALYIEEHQACFLNVTIGRRLLPTTVVRQYAQTEIEKQEKLLEKPLSRTEKRDIKEKMLDELLPQAFVQTQNVALHVDIAKGWILIGSTQEKVLTEVLRLLNATFPGLQLRQLFKEPVRPLLLKALYDGGFAEHFVLGQTCQLVSREQQSRRMIARSMPLPNEGCLYFLNQGYQPSAVGLVFSERVAFVWQDTGQLQSLSLLQHEESEQDYFDEDPILKAAGDRLTTYHECASLLTALLEATQMSMAEATASDAFEFAG